MLPTPRLLILLLLAALPIALSAFAPALIWLALAYLAIVAGLTLSDALLTPRPARSTWSGSTTRNSRWAPKT